MVKCGPMLTINDCTVQAIEKQITRRYTHKVSSIEVAYNVYNSISLWPQGVPKHMAY